MNSKELLTLAELLDITELPDEVLAQKIANLQALRAAIQHAMYSLTGGGRQGMFQDRITKIDEVLLLLISWRDRPRTKQPHLSLAESAARHMG